MAKVKGLYGKVAHVSIHKGTSIGRRPNTSTMKNGLIKAGAFYLEIKHGITSSGALQAVAAYGLFLK